MLTKIKMNNVYSIKECEIDFTKAKYGYKKDMIVNTKYVNPLAIYGYNGSGKSSLINGLGYIVSIMNVGESTKLSPNLFLEKKALRKEADYPYLISSIELEFLVGNNFYSYLILLEDGDIFKEELYLNSKRLLERNRSFYTTYLNYVLTAEVKNIEKSILLELKDEFSEAYDFLSNMIYIADHRTNSISRILLDKDIYHLFTKYSKEVKEILERIPHTFSYEINKRNNEYFVNYGDDNYLPISYLSNGMFNISLIISLILAAPENGVMIIDEIERGLHPFILEEILRLANEKKIQLIFTSQNTHLMSLLRPDQIYFAGFNDLETTFSRLSNLEGNIREVNNIEKMYLSYQFEK